MESKKIMWAPPGGVEALKKKLDEIAGDGGLAVFGVQALERAGTQRITHWPFRGGQPVPATEIVPPHWDCQGATPILLRREEIEVKEEHRPATISRTYMDLETFAAACEAAGIAACICGTGARESYRGIALTLADRKYLQKWIDEEGWHPTYVEIFVSREAYNGNGFHEGTEEYTGQMPIIPAADSDFIGGGLGPTGRRKGLAAWLVQVDEHAMDVELASAPEETEIVEGRGNPETGDFFADDEELPDEFQGMLTADFPRCCMIDGEIVEGTIDECSEGAYYRPDDEFVWQEMSAALEHILRVGAHWEFDSAGRRWFCADCRGEELGPEYKLEER